jgi:triosephosphate isomerase
MKPILIINFKAYEEAIGKNALKLAKICDEVAKKRDVEIMICVQASDIHQIAKKVKIKILSQHVDYHYGKFTGCVSPISIKENGAYGSLINHSERSLDIETIEKTIKECKKVGLKIVACASNLQEAEKISELKPEYIAFEVPELIGTGNSITKEKPESIKTFVKIVELNSIPLCGAGISTKEDFKTALELGTKGVLISSAITKSPVPKKALMDITSI